MAERQTAARLDEIRRDHVARYEWAAARVSGRVLDAACGCGYGAAILARVSDVLGVDRDPGAIDFARTHWPGPDYETGEAAATRRDFDWVVSFETIEHVEDDLGLLRAFRAAAPRLLASVPDEDGMPFDPARFPFHVRHYARGAFRARLAEAGWKVVREFAQAGPHAEVSAPRAVPGRTIVVEARAA